MMNVKKTDSKQASIWLGELPWMTSPNFSKKFQGRTSGDGRGAENAHEVGRAQKGWQKFGGAKCSS